VSRIGSLLEIANKLVNAFTGPLFGIYLLAMFSRRATAVPVLIAGVAGSFASYYVAYRTSIGFMWPSTFGLAATLLVGFAATAVLRTKPTEAALQLTWREVTAVSR
jgi:ABC-type Co2+ transport system permease subunit